MKRTLAIIAAALALVTGARANDWFIGPFVRESWTPLSLSPVAWYKGDGDALDSSGTNNAAWVGDGNYTNGVNGQAFVTANAKYIETPYLSYSSQFSWAAWIFPIGPHTGGYGGAYYDKYNATRNRILSMDDGGLRLQFEIGVQDISWTALPAGTIPTSAWTHLGVVYDGSALTVYRNGVAVTNMAASGNVNRLASAPCWIGRGYPTTYSFLGRLDDTLVFDRALTPAEITRLYNWRQP